MRENAQQLDQRQNEIAEDIKQQIDSERKTLTFSGVNRELADRIDRQREGAEKLIEQMKDVSEQSETSEPLLSRRLYDTLRKAGTDNVDRALEATGELLKRNFLPQAQEIEKLAGKGIEEIRKGVEEAAENVLGDEAESLRLAKQQLDELLRQVNEEAARAGNQGRGQPSDSNEMADSSANQQRPGNAQSETNSRRQGRQSPQQQQQGGRPSANAATAGNRPTDSDPNNPQQQGSTYGGSGSRTANARAGSRRANPGGRTGPGGRLGNQSGQWDSGDPNGPLTGRDFSQWSDRLRDVEEMLTERDLRNEAARIRGRARSIRAEFTRHGKEPEWDIVKQQITNPLTELRKHLSDKLAQLQSDEALVPIDRDPVPARFAELVRRYYENLGGGD
jgi:hypothetical protein